MLTKTDFTESNACFAALTVPELLPEQAGLSVAGAVPQHYKPTRFLPTFLPTSCLPSEHL